MCWMNSCGCGCARTNRCGCQNRCGCNRNQLCGCPCSCNNNCGNRSYVNSCMSAQTNWEPSCGCADDLSCDTCGCSD